MHAIIEDLKRFPHYDGMNLSEVARAYGCLHVCGTVCQVAATSSSGVASPSLQAKPRPHRLVTLTPRVLESLPWWLNLQAVCVGMPFSMPQPSLSPVTDASARGWGAHLDKLRTQGLWSQVELPLHINVRELWTVRLSCSTFQTHLQGSCVSVLKDNTTAVFYINRQGGARSSPVCQEALKLCTQYSWRPPTSMATSALVHHAAGPVSGYAHDFALGSRLDHTGPLPFQHPNLESLHRTGWKLHG